MSSPERLLELARALRSEGVPVGPGEVMDALLSLGRVDPEDGEDVRLALRLAMAKSREGQEIFDALYPLFLERQLLASGPRPPALEAAGKGRGTPGESVTLLPSGKTKDEAVRERPRAGTEGGSGKAPDVDVSAPGLSEVVRELVSIRTTGRRRRLGPAPRGERLDVRRTLRHALPAGGEVWSLRWLGHRPTHPRFVVIIDGSRSMAEEVRLYLAFARVVVAATPRAEVFLFSTEIRRITPSLRRSGTGTRLSLGDVGGGFGGGTLIGPSLKAFLRGEGGRLLGPETVVILVSDGLEAGSVEELGEAMAELHRRVGLVTWLNPLRAVPGYEPLARGIRTALPHVDIFEDGRTEASLRRLVGRIRKGRQMPWMSTGP